MSMDDILKLLVESRQPAKQQPAQSDPMTDLIGSLLGGGQQSGGNQQADAMAGMLGSLLGGGQTSTSGSNQQPDAMSDVLGSLLGGGGQSQTGGQSDAMSGMLGNLLGGQSQTSGGQQSGLSGMMGLLEMVTGAGQQGSGQSSLTASNPIMGMLQPFVAPLAKKLKISPEIAMIVVSFVVQKMLAHHPTSGRDSNQFNLDDLLNQIGSAGKVNPAMLQNSGMVDELARVSGLDKATAAKSLDAAFSMVGKRALNAASPSAGRNVAGSGRNITR